jgi:hypothetical protein
LSYSISISGHSTEPHNDAVKQIAEEATRKLQALPGGTASLGGYSNDNTGRITLGPVTPEVK